MMPDLWYNWESIKTKYPYQMAGVLSHPQFYQKGLVMSNVYVMSANGQPYSKIGVSDDPINRLSGVQTGSPHKLHLVAYIECPDRHYAETLEARLHRRYAMKRAEGEWFNISPSEVLADLQQILDISECITGVKVLQEISTETKQVFYGQERRRNRAAYQNNVRVLVFAYLDNNPDSARLPARTLAQLVGVGHDSANKYRNEWTSQNKS